MEQGGLQQLCGLVAPPWDQLLSPPLPCLGHQKGADGGDADGGSGSRSRCIQMAQAQAEAVPRPVAGVAVTWLTSVWPIQ